MLPSVGLWDTPRGLNTSRGLDTFTRNAMDDDSADAST